jgi:hypothetical protein
MSCVTLATHVAGAQVADAPARAPGVAVSGVVRDSIARAPLVGAWVQLAAADSARPPARTVLSDSLGRFTFDGVPPGRYLLGFFHALLDTLGVEAPARDITVRKRAVRADLAIPSVERIRAAVCGVPTRKGATAGALVVGTVRDAITREPAPNATVTVEWLEYSFQRGVVSHSRPQLTATTGANGWYALCNVPNAGVILLGAARGLESSDVLETQMPLEHIIRRDLFLGQARLVTLPDSVAVDSQRVPRRIRGGDGRLSGTVITADGNRPLAGALVRIADGPAAKVNERGEWTITDAPTGTRMLDVRAVGYYAQHRAVDVITNAAPVQVTLSTFRAVLDTVRVTARRVAYRHDSGFEFRRRSGAGHYITAEQIERRAPVVASDIFRGIPEVKIGYQADTLVDNLNQVVDPNALLSNDRLILVRGAFGPWCAPNVFIDGIENRVLTADEFDSFLNPKAIAAVEIYSEATVPPQFRSLRGGCGTIVIWTK